MKILNHCYHNVTRRRIIFLYNILITQLSFVALLLLFCTVGIHVAMRTMDPHTFATLRLPLPAISCWIETVSSVISLIFLTSICNSHASMWHYRHKGWLPFQLKAFHRIFSLVANFPYQHAGNFSAAHVVVLVYLSEC